MEETRTGKYDLRDYPAILATFRRACKSNGETPADVLRRYIRNYNRRYLLLKEQGRAK